MDFDCKRVNRNLIKLTEGKLKFVQITGGKPKFPQITGGEIFHEGPKPNKF